MKKKNKIGTLNTLLAICGKNPQVVTEAVYMLSVECRIEFNSISIITTNNCAVDLASVLNAENAKLSIMYNVNIPKINDEDIIIADIEVNNRTNKSKYGNILIHKQITNVIFQTIGEISSDSNTILHCLISGGFKTMSADAVMAMMLYGRETDKMYHILCTEEFERSGKFFPENKIEASMLELIDKPFLKLRNKLGTAEIDTYDYDAIIAGSQQKIDELTDLPVLEIDESNRSLRIGSVVLELPPMQFAIYLFYAKQKNFIRGGKNFSPTSSAQIWRIYRKQSPSVGHTDRVHKTMMRNDRMDFDIVQKSISTISNKLRTSLSRSPIAEYYIIKTEGTYGDKKYGILLPKNKIKYVKLKTNRK